MREIKQLKNRIQKYREEKGLTQDELAKELDITRTYLSKLENNKFPPGPDLIVRVCEFFGKELGEIFYIGEGR